FREPGSYSTTTRKSATSKDSTLPATGTETCKRKTTPKKTQRRKPPRPTTRSQKNPPPRTSFRSATLQRGISPLLPIGHRPIMSVYAVETLLTFNTADFGRFTLRRCLLERAWEAPH